MSQEPQPDLSQATELEQAICSMFKLIYTLPDQKATIEELLYRLSKRGKIHLTIDQKAGVLRIIASAITSRVLEFDGRLLTVSAPYKTKETLRKHIES